MIPTILFPGKDKNYGANKKMVTGWSSTGVNVGWGDEQLKD